jgi:hypothetical protein
VQNHNLRIEEEREKQIREGTYNETRFKAKNKSVVPTKNEMIKLIDKFTGTTSDKFLGPQFKSKSMINTYDEKPTVSFKQKIKGTTQRLNLKADLDDQRSFRFVGQASTQNEKLLKYRADIIANDPGLKIHGVEMPEPSKKFMLKITREEMLKKQNEAKEQLTARDEDDNASLKFKMRDDKQYQTMMQTLSKYNTISAASAASPS